MRDKKSIGQFIPVFEESFPKVLDILKTRLPRSCHVYNMVMSQKRFSDRMSVFTLNGSLENDAWILVCSYREDFGNDYNISAPLEPNVTEGIKEAFSDSGLIAWDMPYIFPTTDRNVSKMIVEISTFIKGNITTVAPCFIYFTEEAEALSYQNRNSTVQQVQDLDPEEGPQFISESWKHARAGTKEYIEYLIRTGYSQGVYIEDKPVCGVLTHANGTIGMLHTSENHRRKGYAAICMKSIMKQHAANGLIPCSAAEIPNKASQILHEKLGMKFSHIADYIYSDGQKQ